jgi:hypothetical protein
LDGIVVNVLIREADVAERLAAVLHDERAASSGPGSRQAKHTRLQRLLTGTLTSATLASMEHPSLGGLHHIEREKTDDTVSATLRFPGNRIAQFCISNSDERLAKKPPLVHAPSPSLK